jgi:septum formation protein
MKLILASSSPRRAAYLKDLSIDFRKVVPNVDETRHRNESPRAYVRRVALDKASAVAERRKRDWVVGADTTVVIDNKVLGKPRDPSEARKMLRTLSGRSHRVMSGIALVHADDAVARSAVSTTRVFIRSLSRGEIDWYVGTGESLDKAGAYGAQGQGGLLISRIEGSFSNVVGFPLEKFYELLTTCNIRDAVFTR